MPARLLPTSAAPFEIRSDPIIVLETEVDSWLKTTLKGIQQKKRPLNTVQQLVLYLREILSSPSALWTLCSLQLSKAPDSDLVRSENPLIEAVLNYKMIAIEAYVVYVDMVSQKEVAFKLTPETISILVEFYNEVYSKNITASTWCWPGKHVQLKNLHEEFVQAANKYVYRTSAEALEGLEGNGAGELLSGRAEEVKTAIVGLFHSLIPPSPRHV